MACFWLNQNETNIKIIEAEDISNVIFYKIQVNVGGIKWTVSHRYNEFFELHNQLICDHGVSKDILPCKKIIRNKTPQFIENRRKGLEEYLTKIFIYLKRRMPKTFLEFLHFHLYDIFFLLQYLSLKIFSQVDYILSTTKTYSFTTLELHALSECLIKLFPISETAECRLDLSPILDLCSQITTLNINGSSLNYLQSNITPNKLKFELSSFKVVNCLIMKNVSMEMIYSLGNLRSTVNKLFVHNTNATNMSQILQCDLIHKNNIEGSSVWSVLEELDLSNNNLVEIDKTVNLLPNLKKLVLNDNKISTISNLSQLPNLSHLSLSNNLISICDRLHVKIGNILSLNLSQNNLTSLECFKKLYSLENLDLSCNKICDIDEIVHIRDLPCLENLLLTGNNVATTVDYRIKVLEYFHDRAKDICLDNEKASQSELDKVCVLHALRIVKEGKTPNFNH